MFPVLSLAVTFIAFVYIPPHKPLNAGNMPPSTAAGRRVVKAGQPRSQDSLSAPLLCVHLHYRRILRPRRTPPPPSVPRHPRLAGDAFAAVALFNALRFPLMQMGQTLTLAAHAQVAIRRIDTFLCSGLANVGAAPSTTTSQTAAGPAAASGSAAGGGDVILKLTDAKLTWALHGGTGSQGGQGDLTALPSGEAAASEPKLESRAEIVPVEPEPAAKQVAVRVASGTGGGEGRAPAHRSFVLRGITLAVRRGELVTVVGPVGSGKSLLINGRSRRDCCVARVVRATGSRVACMSRPFGRTFSCYYVC